MLILNDEPAETKVIQLSGVATLAPTGRRWLNAIHPGGRDGRIGVGTAKADFEEVILLAEDIDEAALEVTDNNTKPVVFEELAKRVLLMRVKRMAPEAIAALAQRLGREGVGDGSPASITVAMRAAIGVLARHLREAMDAGLDSYEAAARIVAADREALRR